MDKTMILITDFGHDPDDVIALSYLIEHGVIPEVIIINPGFDNQVKYLNGFLKLYGLNSKVSIFKSMIKYGDYNGGPHKIFHDDTDYENVYSLLDEKKLSFKNGLSIGPLKNCKDRVYCENITMQGGYSPNSINPLPKFVGVKACQSFNPGGAPEDFEWLVKQGGETRRLVGKNICHGYTLKDIGWKPQERLVSKFYGQLSPNKKMHDVLAAKMYIDHEDGIWEKAMPVRINGEYTTTPTEQEIYTLIGLK